LFPRDLFSRKSIGYAIISSLPCLETRPEIRKETVEKPKR
jgi:hypothetical protein